MTKILFFSLVFAAVVAIPASAQEPASQKSLSSSLNVHVFPTAGQAADQQSKDEAECYQWAATNSGVDPFNLSKETAAVEQQAQAQQQQVQPATQGAGAKGAVKGAAAKQLSNNQPSRRSSKYSRLKPRAPKNAAISTKRSAFASRARSTWSSSEHDVHYLAR